MPVPLAAVSIVSCVAPPALTAALSLPVIVPLARVGGGHRLGAGRLERDTAREAVGARVAGHEGVVARQRGPRVGGAELHRAGVAGRGVAVGVLGAHGEALGAARGLAGEAAQGELRGAARVHRDALRRTRAEAGGRAEGVTAGAAGKDHRAREARNTVCEVERAVEDVATQQAEAADRAVVGRGADRDSVSTGVEAGDRVAVSILCGDRVGTAEGHAGGLGAGDAERELGQGARHVADGRLALGGAAALHGGAVQRGHEDAAAGRSRGGDGRRVAAVEVVDDGADRA